MKKMNKYMNVFVKPDDQSDACISYGMARKGGMKSNPIAPSKRQNICSKIKAIIIITIITDSG
jgi:hypothetical protein